MEREQGAAVDIVGVGTAVAEPDDGYANLVEAESTVIGQSLHSESSMGREDGGQTRRGFFDPEDKTLGGSVEEGNMPRSQYLLRRERNCRDCVGWPYH